MAEEKPTPAAAPNAQPDGTQPGTQATAGADEAKKAAALLSEVTKLREQKRELEEWKASKTAKEEEAEKARLTQNQEFQKLAEAEAKKASEYKQQLEETIKRQEMVYVDAQLRALSSQLLDPEDLRLFNVEKLKVENGNVVNLAEEWKAFQERKPHLFRKDGLPKPSPSSLHPGTAGQTVSMGSATSLSKEAWEAHVKASLQRQ